jgi:ferrous iron transport protein B
VAERILMGLAGNPNTGKSSLFNALTGARQHVGNWPGKTVEVLRGSFEFEGVWVEVVDLPGTYSLAPLSAEEEIAAGFLLQESPDVVVTVVDATCLERSLYLAVQLAEMGLPQVLALNMSDVADRSGMAVDAASVSRALGVPVVRTIGRRGEGVGEVGGPPREAAPPPRGAGWRDVRAAAGAAARKPGVPLRIDYGTEIESAVEAVTRSMTGPGSQGALAQRWAALALLSDGHKESHAAGVPDGGETLRVAADERRRIEETTGKGSEVVIAEHRYRWIEDVVAGSVATARTDAIRPRRGVDALLTHRLLGVPIFLAAMWLVFRLTTDVSAAFMVWIDETVSGPVSRWLAALLGWIHLDGTWVQSLLIDGLLPGVGMVLAFVPVLGSLYLALGLLEDSGYMGRAALVMHRAMRVLGLPGKAFLPMLVGFGCTVPAVYATRTLDTRRDRLLAGLLVPLMSCGARLPVYILLASVFFARNRGLVVFAMYLLGILVSAVVGKTLSRTLLRQGDESPFVMQMPPLRLPHRRTVVIAVKRRIGLFLRGAGRTILLASLVVWLLLAVPVSGGGAFGRVELEDSAMVAASRAAAPVLSPLGFGGWEQASALVGGLAAKEVVVGTLAATFGVEDGATGTVGPPPSFVEDLASAGRGLLEAGVEAVAAFPRLIGIDPIGSPAVAPEGLISAVRVGFEASSGGRGALAGIAFMVFVLLYSPCIPAASALRQEFGARWMWMSILGQTALAWIAAFLVFQGGRLLGAG